jgi:subtilisin family serine protease
MRFLHLREGVCYLAGVVKNLKSANMRKLILLLSILPLLTYAQVEEDEYRKELRKVKREIDNDADIQLPEEELVGVYPNMRSLSTGNWGYHFVGINDEVIRQRATRKVNIVILDTGIPQHPYLRPYTDYSLSFSTTGETNTIDAQGHATHCGGIIAANHPTLKIGVATELARMNLLKVIYGKVLRDNGSGTYTAIVAGVDKAVEILKGLDGFGIISMSLGGGGDNVQLREAIQRAKDAGIYVVAASGNTGSKGVQIPARYALPVAALNSDGRRANFSTTGPEVFTSAPGVDILSTYRDTMASLSGTSMATPLYAGMVAIVASINPTFTAREIEAMPQTDVPPTGRDEETGLGYLHFNQIVAPAPPPPPPPPNPAPPTVPKRTVSVVLEGGDAKWRVGAGPIQLLTVTSIEVQVTSTLPDEVLYDQLSKASELFFQKWTFTMPKSYGYIISSRAVGSFWNTLVGKENGAQVTTLFSQDQQGRKAVTRFFPTAKTNEIVFATETVVVKPTIYERIKGLRL